MPSALLRKDGAGEVERRGPRGEWALRHQLSSFTLGDDDDEKSYGSLVMAGIVNADQEAQS